MRVFNLAEELEKERKKNKKILLEKELSDSLLLDADEHIQELQDRIDKAIEDLEKTKKYNKNVNGLIKVDIDHIEYLLDILKGR